MRKSEDAAPKTPEADKAAYHDAHSSEPVTPERAGHASEGQTEPVEGSSAREYHSTPSRKRTVTSNFYRMSIDEDIKADLRNYTNEDISPSEFMKSVFDLSDKDYDELDSRIKSWGTLEEPEYTTQRDAFLSAKLEHEMYKPLEQMGNLIIKRAEQEFGTSTQIRLYSSGDLHMKGRFSLRKPDIFLVPLSVWERLDREDRERKSQSTSRSVSGRRKAGVSRQSGSTPPCKPDDDKRQISPLEVLVPFELKYQKGKMKRKSVEMMDEDAESAATRKPKRQRSASIQRTRGRSSGRAGRGKTNVPTGLETPARPVSDGPVMQSAELSSDNQFPFQTTSSDRPGNLSGYKLYASRSSAGAGMMSGSDSLVYSENIISGSSTATSIEDPKVKNRTQLASYAAELSSTRGDRVFVFGVRIEGAWVKLTYYDRSGSVEAERFNLDSHPELFAIFLASLAREPLHGFNTSMGFFNPFNLNDEETKRMGAQLTQVKDATNEVLKDDLPLGQLILTETVMSQYCLVGRGTSVIKTKMPGYDIELATKFCWQVSTRPCEFDMILRARKISPEHVPEIYGFAVVKINTPIKTLVDKCQVKMEKPEWREFRILVMKYYKPLHELDDKTFWKCIIQAARCEFCS